MIAGILLAAGRSQRMGQQKLLLPWNGVPLVRYVAHIALQSKLDHLLVVVGHRADHVRAALDGLPVTIVHNSDFLAGQSTSVHTGVAALDETVEAAVIMLADQPLLQPATIDTLIETYRHHRPRIVAPRYGGQRGNPVLFDRALFGLLQTLAGDQGARPVIQANVEHMQLVDVEDEGVVLDLDTPDAYRQARDRFR